MIQNLRMSKVWEDIISILCPRCFQLARDKEGLVKEMGKWQGDGWSWHMEWRRERRGREKSEEQVLWEVLDNIQIKEGVADRWKWKYEVDVDIR
ncbi:hypothetical protein SLA2020_417460 [Shorea laevis]